MDFHSAIQTRKKKGPPPRPEQVVTDEEQEGTPEKAPLTRRSVPGTHVPLLPRRRSGGKQQVHDVPDAHLRQISADNFESHKAGPRPGGRFLRPRLFSSQPVGPRPIHRHKQQLGSSA